MRHVCFSMLCAMAMMLIACGGGGSNGTLTGNWAATLTNSSGSTMLAFNATLTQGSSDVITVSNLIFTMETTCFGSGTSGTATLNATTNATGGPFQMILMSGTSTINGVNQVTLQGTPANDSISGTWNLTGSGTGCKGSGSFSMFQM